jgi:hypothetical protein
MVRFAKAAKVWLENRLNRGFAMWTSMAGADENCMSHFSGTSCISGVLGGSNGQAPRHDWRLPI